MGGDDKEEVISRCLVYARLRPTKALDNIGKDGVYQLVNCNKKIIKLGDEKTYEFDGSFTPANTQEEIFNEVAKPSLEHVLKGFTSAIMCYGQTGTGKSYTMSHKVPGQEAIIPRSANYLFEKINAQNSKEYQLSAHFVQIYRDTLSDLMVDPKEKQKVDIRFQEKTGVEITNCTEVPVTSTAQFMEMYEQGDARRVVRPTKMNPDSSRGHTALVLYVKSKSIDPDDMSKPTSGKITFIDLAGYERFEKTGLKDPVHIDEAKKINASLLALGYVVTALSNADKHIPWRNAKLTRLLQDSIGGKSRSTIVITCGPASTNLHETTNSFDFGNRAMAVKVSAKVEVDVDYQKLAAKLQKQLEEQAEKLDKLELAEKTREVEKAQTLNRHKADLERLRNRHKEELNTLLEEGATKERIQKLIEMQDVETETLQDMQKDENDVQEDHFNEEKNEIVKEEMEERVKRERIRGSSMRKQATEDKRKELHAAYTLIAQLRAGSDDLPDDETLKKIHDEISLLAGSTKTPHVAHLLANREPPPGGLSIDAPMLHETGSNGSSPCPSPHTVNNAEIGILKQEMEDMKKQLEATEKKGKDAIDKMKAAHLKAAAKLKEERERNQNLLKTTASLDKLEAIAGELDEVKEAKKEAERMLEEAQERVTKLEENLNGMSARVWQTQVENKKKQAQLDTVVAEKDDLEEKYAMLEQEKGELEEEFNRKKRDIEIKAEEADAVGSRAQVELKTEIETLKASIADHETTIAEAQQKLADVAKELEDTQAAKEQQAADLRAEINAAQGTAAASSKDLDDGRAELAKRTAEVNELLAQAQDETAAVRREMQKEVEDMQSRTSLEAIGLRERIAELEKEVETLREEARATEAAHAAALAAAATSAGAAADAAAAEAAGLRTALEEVQAQNERQAEEVSGLTAEAAAAKDAQSAVEAERDALRGEVADLTAQVEAREASLVSQNAALADVHDKISGMEAAAATTAAEKEALAGQNEELEAALAAVEAEKKAVHDEREALTVEVAALRESATAEQGAAAEQLSAAQRAVSELEAAKGKLEARVETLEAEAERMGADMDELQKALEDEQSGRTQDGKAAAEEHDALSKARDAFMAEKEAADARIRDLEASAAEADKQLEELTTDRESLRAKLQDTEDALATAREEVSMRDTAIAEGDDERDALAAEKNALAERVKELEAEVAKRAEEEARLAEEVKERGANEARLEKEVGELKDRTDALTATIAARDEKINGLEAAGGESGEREKLLLAERDEVKAALDAAAAERDQMRDNLTQTQGLVRERDAENEDLKKQLADDAERVEELTAKVETLEEKEKTLEEDLEAAKEDLEDEKELGAELAEEKEALQLELDEYKDQSDAALREKEAEEEKLKNTVASLEDELANSAQYQEALETRVKELESQLVALQGDLNVEISKAQIEAEEAKKKMLEERKLRDEETERLKEEAARDAERMRDQAAREAEEMERRLKEETEKVGGGKYKYTSKVISQLERVGQFAIPRDAPSLARPEGLLVSLDPEEVKSALRYNLIVVGAQQTGKSSVQHCLVKGSHGLVRRAPDTVTPTTAFEITPTVYREKSGGGGGFLKKQTNQSNTYFNVWDTPCDPRHMGALPPGTLPVAGSCYIVTFDITADFSSESARMRGVLQQIWANVKSEVEEGVRLPVMLLGTRRDMITSKDNVVVLKKIGEAKRWLKETPRLNAHFALVDCFAVSCKEWTVQGDTGLKTGISSFSQLQGFLAADIANRYPITPPALLGEVEDVGANLDMHDWWTTLNRVSARDDAEATRRAGHKAVLSLMLHLNRLRLRNVWLVGHMEFEATIFDHIPSHVHTAQPFLKQQLKKICRQWAMAFPIVDKAQNDAREGVVVTKIDVLANYCASLLLPTVYLSSCEVYAEREKPGHLKNVMQKHARLSVEEVWRPDWQLMFDGKIPPTSAPALLKTTRAFENDVRLGQEFLNLLDVSFKVRDIEDEETYDFLPAMALRSLSNTMVSMLLACFSKTGGWIANTTKNDPLSYAEIGAIQKRVYGMDPASAKLWCDGAAVMVDGRWAFVRLSTSHCVVCCEGKDSPLLAALKAAIMAAAPHAGIADATWKDGMMLDNLPRLAPAYTKQVEDAASIEAFLKGLSKEIMRGVPYPQATMDKDLRRRGGR